MFAPAYVPGNALPGTATFTRNLEGAQTQAGGGLTFLAANIPRDAHYIGGVRTLLIEPASTNVALQTADFNDVSWLNFSGAFGGAVVGIDGVAAKGRIWGASSVDAQFYKDVAALAVGDYSCSFYGKGINGVDLVRVELLGNPNSNDYVSANKGPIGNGVWTRFVHSRNAPTGPTRYGIRSRSDGATTNHSWHGLQLEPTLNPTSWIRTAAAAVTRGADVLQYPASGTLYEKWLAPDGTVTETIRAYVAGGNIGPAALGIARGYTSIKLGLGSYSLAEMRAAVV